eukprot:TRINITY_DN3769_c0_g1_i6.p1 TRINITY_DN3769_c0_g1~~TRINITY_DN3769_c0_g1_i6.p1  ORF type:complete len:139 (-),score=18.35 TRINITY_DN3769_c0_g1_i6:110-526(-)
MISVIDDWAGRKFGSKSVIIVEGFLLYSHPPLIERLDKKLYITVDKATCYKRRQNTNPVPIHYFENVLWPEFLKHNQHITEIPGIMIVDGTLATEEVCQVAENFFICGGRGTLSAHRKHQENLRNNLDISTISTKDGI